jgi:hypothetical protein
LIAQGKSVEDVCRVNKVTQPTYHRWRQHYGEMQAEEARRLTQLETENAWLKKLLAEAELEKKPCSRTLRSENSEPERCCRAVTVMEERYWASERFICRVVVQHRSTQLHPPKVVSLEEGKLRHRLREIAADHTAGVRGVAFPLLRKKSWTVNRKRARPADGSLRPHLAEHPHQVRAMDFQFDATADGRRLMFPNVIDEHSRLFVAIRFRRRCKAPDVLAVLEQLTTHYPAPMFIRYDNGPEAGVHRSCPTGLVRGKQHHQHGVHRARIPMGERLCRVVQRALPG